MTQWKKVKIGDVCKIVKGTTGIASAKPGEYPLVVTAVERKTCSDYQFDCEAVCIPLVSSSGHGKKSLNNVHYQSGKFALGTILCAVIPNNSKELDARYLHQYLQFYKDTVLVPLMKGAANVSLSMKDIATVEIPLPPIERQRELSAMFISLQEKSQQLRAESEKQIEYAKQLRASILQDAIEGKLTADWREKHPVKKGDPDYDAEALFEKIQAEKQEKGKKQKPLPAITEDEKPFAIPTNWKWVRLGDAAEILGGYAYKSHLFKEEGNNLVLRLGNIRTGYLRYEASPAFVSEDIAKDTASYKILKNDIIVTMTGTRGKRDYLYTLLIDANHVSKYNMFLNQRLANIRSLYSPKYVYDVLQNDVLKEPIFESATGSANQANIGMPALQKWAIPYPPLAEQNEIVARIEKHLETITQLETQIATRETLTKQLMQGLLKDAFEEK